MRSSALLHTVLYIQYVINHAALRDQLVLFSMVHADHTSLVHHGPLPTMTSILSSSWSPVPHEQQLLLSLLPPPGYCRGMCHTI